MAGIEHTVSGCNVQRSPDMDRALMPQDVRRIGHSREGSVVNRNTQVDQQQQFGPGPWLPSQPLPNERSPFSLLPAEMVIGIASKLTVLEQRALALAGPAMAVPLLTTMKRLSDLQQAVELVTTDLGHATSQLTPEQHQQIADAVNDATLPPNQSDEVLARFQPSLQRWADTLQLNRHRSMQSTLDLVDAMLVRTSTWPAVLHERGVEAIAATLLDAKRSTLGYELNRILRLDDSVDPAHGVSLSVVGMYFTSDDDAVRTAHVFLKESARRPPLFRSIALAGALKQFQRLPQGVRTPLIDEVSNQAGQLPAKQRDQLRERLRAEAVQLP